ncbi:MAG: SIS domain-containing protein [Anaerolineae bacterium]|nr:SIS domain-containing protein [Anaerolineae bacterium]
MTAIETLLRENPDLAPCVPDLERAFALLRNSYRAGGKVLVCGNGGSAADSEHIVGELMKGYLLPRTIPQATHQKLVEGCPAEGTYLAEHLQGALPAISLVSQVALMTAFANDVAADMIFAQQVYGYGRSGDVLWALSVSGVSVSVLHALQVARARGVWTLGFTGATGGAMPSLCDVTLYVPRASVAAVQSGHQALYHALCEMLEAEFFA